MPYVTDGPDGPQWVTKSGANFGLKNGVGPSGAKLVPGQNRASTSWPRPACSRTARRTSTASAIRISALKDMDRDGVDAEVIFGILGSASKMQDNEAATEMFRIYNDWLKDFCSHYPDRHIGLACLPYGDVECGGGRGPPLSPRWACAAWNSPAPGTWSRCGTRAGSRCGRRSDDVQLPLHFHTFPTTPPRAREMTSGQVRRAAMFTGVSAFQMGLIHILAAMMGAGVFERYPRLRVSFGESGIGWIPYALDRMDFEFEDRFRDLMKLKPSEYWQRQCKATFQFDPIGPKLLNINNLMTRIR